MIWRKIEWTQNKNILEALQIRLGFRLAERSRIRGENDGRAKRVAELPDTLLNSVPNFHWKQPNFEHHQPTIREKRMDLEWSRVKLANCSLMWVILKLILHLRIRFNAEIPWNKGENFKQKLAKFQTNTNTCQVKIAQFQAKLVRSSCKIPEFHQVLSKYSLKKIVQFCFKNCQIW